MHSRLIQRRHDVAHSHARSLWMKSACSLLARFSQGTPCCLERFPFIGPQLPPPPVPCLTRRKTQHAHTRRAGYRSTDPLWLSDVPLLSLMQMNQSEGEWGRTGTSDKTIWLDKSCFFSEWLEQNPLWVLREMCSLTGKPVIKQCLDRSIPQTGDQRGRWAARQTEQTAAKPPEGEMWQGGKEKRRSLLRRNEMFAVMRRFCFFFWGPVAVTLSLCIKSLPNITLLANTYSAEGHSASKQNVLHILCIPLHAFSSKE